jgi:hypothetical protein
MKPFSEVRTNRSGRNAPGKRGMATIIMIVLLSIIFIYVAANARTLHHLGRELKLIEQRQTRRVSPLHSHTNSVAVTNASWTASPLSVNP